MQKELMFSIITPTYRRPESLNRCTQSVLIQNHTNWEMIIIDDSGENYEKNTSEYLSNSKIKYFKNSKNKGNNFSKNFALENISKSSDYIIFLDDDDWLHADSLSKIDEVLKKKYEERNTEEIPWLVTNRSVEDKSLTRNKTDKKYLNYFLNYLVFKNFSGDATHIIKSEIATRFRFSNNIKNGEEVFYFIQIPNNFLYKNINTTNTEGYLVDGMTADLKNKYTKNTWLMWTEMLDLKKLQKLSIPSILKIIFYLEIRTLYSVLKTFKKRRAVAGHSK